MVEYGLEVAWEHGFDAARGCILILIGWWFGRWRTSRQWKNQEFYSRIHFSLTLLHDGQLQIRTLGEKNCLDVFGNATAVRTIAEAARKAPVNTPLLDLPRDAYWSFLNSVVNEVSPICAGAFLAVDMGAPLRRETYVICLTCERTAEVRTRKIRAMVVRKALLAALPETTPAFSRETDAVRWSTLQTLATGYRTMPWKFIEVELVGS